jgi:hypothetical protein
MADTVETKWIYPANWDGNQYEPGEKIPGYRKVIIQLTGLSVGTGETNVKKLDISELRTANGDICTRTVVEKIEYEVSGMNVLLTWDRAAPAVIARLSGTGCIEEDRVDPSDGVGDKTGDILLTSTSVTSGDLYRITLHVRLKS